MTATMHMNVSSALPHASLRKHPQVDIFAGIFPAYVKSGVEVKRIIEDMVNIINDPTTSDDERHAALDTLVEIFFPQDDGFGVDLESPANLNDSEAVEAEKAMSLQESIFSDNLRSLMKTRKMTQQKLAEKAGVGQSAISMMVKRKCRPQQGTIARIAEALGVKPQELWPTA